MSQTVKTIAACCLSAIILSACQTAPQKSVDIPSDTLNKKADLVVMPSRMPGSKEKSLDHLKVMTPDELRFCAQSLHDIKLEYANIETQNKSLKNRKTELAATEEKLIDRRLKIDKNDVALVKGLNQEGNTYFEGVKQLQLDINAYNEKVNKTNQANTDYNRNCINRLYNASDLLKLEPALIEVMQNSSQVLDIPIFGNTSMGSGGEMSTTTGSKGGIHLRGSTNR